MWSKFLELPLQELRKLLDHWTTGPLDSGLPEYSTTGLPDQKPSRPQTQH